MDRKTLSHAIDLQCLIDDKKNEILAASNGSKGVLVVIDGYEKTPIRLPYNIIGKTVQEYLKDQYDKLVKEFADL